MLAINYATQFTVAAPEHAVTTNQLIHFLCGQVINHLAIIVGPWSVGPTMMAKRFQIFLQQNRIDLPTMAYHHQANGLVEHVIQKLKTMT